MAPTTTSKQRRGVGSFLLLLSIPLIVIVAFILQHPQPTWDWEKDFLPMAKDMMGTQNADHEILKGLTVVITGATNGIGKALTLFLLSKGATVVAMGRSKSKLQQLQTEATSGGQLVPFTMEQSNLQSVAEAAEEIKKQFPSIDVLVCNAGMHYQKGINLLSTDFWKDLSSTDGFQTPYGHDYSFTVNYLSHFLLAEKLLPELLSNGAADDEGESTNALMNTVKPMVLHMSSSFHWGTDGRDLAPGDGVAKSTTTPLAAQPGGGSWFWRGPRAYMNSKLAQILHGRAYQQLHPGVRNVFVCPTFVATGIVGSEGTVSHTGLSMLAFPLEADGWGLQSTLRALLDRQHDDQDFYINSELSKVPYYFPMQSAFPAWVSDAGLRDVWIHICAGVIFFSQKFAPASTTALSSVESYNMTLATSLYDWSMEQVKEFI
jgi:NAD(P)-dependent dehydrogenase (short-subunit alcohol dehydrogenase family)